MAALPITSRLVSDVEKVNHWKSIVGIFDERNPLLSIKQACRYLPQYVNYNLQTQVAMAIQKMREVEMKQKIAAVPGMTESGAAAIWMYTQDGPLYRDLNGRLQKQDWGYLENHYYPFMRILLTAMKSLQHGEYQQLFHGVNDDVMSRPEEENMYESGKRFVWWSISSTTPDNDDGNSFFRQERGVVTVFQIKSKQGADVSEFAYCVSGRRERSEKKEILLPPGTVLKSLGVVRTADGVVVQCEDDESAPQLIF